MRLHERRLRRGEHARALGRLLHHRRRVVRQQVPRLQHLLSIQHEEDRRPLRRPPHAHRARAHALPRLDGRRRRRLVQRDGAVLEAREEVRRVPRREMQRRAWAALAALGCLERAHAEPAAEPVALHDTARHGAHQVPRRLRRAELHVAHARPHARAAHAAVGALIAAAAVGRVRERARPPVARRRPHYAHRAGLHKLQPRANAEAQVRLGDGALAHRQLDGHPKR
mmetsp:Transcript_2270/g.7579  ORF Transcript_2270/g.7579 Transcript_2270/m.7579 type:complete len:226 (-) Transcript_2270:1690-2367(-)